jgi:hypothetical protein
VSGAWCFCKCGRQARFEWSKVLRRVVSFHSMIAGTPPEMGTKRSEVGEPRPRISLVEFAPTNHQVGGCTECNDRISSLCLVRCLKVHQFHRAERLLVSITDPHLRLDPPVRRSGGLPLQTLCPGTMALFSVLSVPTPLVPAPCSSSERCRNFSRTTHGRSRPF